MKVYLHAPLDTAVNSLLSSDFYEKQYGVISFHLFLSAYPSFSLYPSVHPYIYLAIHLSVYLSASPSDPLSICRGSSPSIHPYKYVPPSICIDVSAIHPPTQVCLFVCPSSHPHIQYIYPCRQFTTVVQSVHPSICP